MQETKDLISIIVPVYNTEKYLRKCLDSIIKQTYTNIEIILIDDGSTDNSGDICDKYALKDNRIRVYHIDNSGPAIARNIGISKATGEYIMFVDSDDWIACDTILFCYNTMLSASGDIVIFNLNKCYPHRTEEVVLFNHEYIQFSGDKLSYIKHALIIPETITSQSNLCLTGICCKLYSKKVIYNCFFPNNMKHYEDWCFNIKVFENAHKIVYTEKKLYYYRILENSLSHGISAREFTRENLRVTNWILQFYLSNKMEKIGNNAILSYDDLNEFFFKNYSEVVCKVIADNTLKLTEKRKYIKWYLNNLNFGYDLKKISYKCKNRNLQILRFLVIKKCWILLWIAIKIVEYKNKK